MRPAATVLLVLGCVATGAIAQNYTPWRQPDGSQITGSVLNCATPESRLATPCGGYGSPVNVMSMPFQRGHSNPIRLKNLGPTPKTFSISRPADATTYRIVNPCNEDIRVRGVANETDVVTEDTGILYLARTEATMGTSRPNFISAMTIGTPEGECTPEMHYGMGGG